MALLNPLDVTYYFKSMDLKSPTIVRLEESDKCLECKTFGNYYSSSFKSSLSKRGSMFTRSCVNRKNRRFQCPTGSFCRRYFLVSIRWCTFCSRMLWQYKLDIQELLMEYNFEEHDFIDQNIFYKHLFKRACFLNSRVL